MFHQRSTTKIKAASSFFKGRKGTPNKRIIKEFERDCRMHQLHATKGWRSYRLIENHKTA